MIFFLLSFSTNEKINFASVCLSKPSVFAILCVALNLSQIPSFKKCYIISQNSRALSFLPNISVSWSVCMGLWKLQTVWLAYVFFCFVFLWFLSNNGALWHRKTTYIRLWQHRLARRIINHLVGFVDNKENTEYHQTSPINDYSNKPRLTISWHKVSVLTLITVLTMRQLRVSWERERDEKERIRPRCI